MNSKNDYGIICDVGGKGKGNEDSAFLMISDLIIAPGSPQSKCFNQRVVLAIICDGVSGSTKGEEGSTFTIRNLSSRILNYLSSENVDITQIHIVLEQLIKQTNTELLQKFKVMIEKENKIPKTTLVGILVIGQWLWIFNLGDSRAFFIQEKEIIQISMDHIGAMAHEITQAIGEPTITPFINVYQWFSYDKTHEKQQLPPQFYFLICSDGLTDKVNAEEIKNLIIQTDKQNNLQEKIEKLYQLSIDRNINDNVSIISVDLIKYIESISPIQLLKLSQE